MQIPVKNEFSNMNFEIYLIFLLTYSKRSKLVPEHSPDPKKMFFDHQTHPNMFPAEMVKINFAQFSSEKFENREMCGMMF